jgi:hypothetical protein
MTYAAWYKKTPPESNGLVCMNFQGFEWDHRALPSHCEAFLNASILSVFQPEFQLNSSGS